ncbi:MAG: hypothetical protein JSU98_06585 [Gemmatimonadales bacterium]|nr:MAG: hypothetical protein JSU98_06585 [Gemmatimonadales bacterium]
MRIRNLIPVLVLLASPLAVHGQAPVQISLFPPAQLVSEDEEISGFRLSLYGRNAGMTGLDLGLVTHTTGDATALQIGAVNIVEGDFTGVQAGWAGGSLANITRGQMKGLQFALYNGAGSGQGLQWGFVNNTEGRMEGLQISFVNIANDLHGVQVGLINIIRSKDRFPVLPIVNWKFDN